MSQIVSVKTDIKNFPSLEKAAKSLGYKIAKTSDTAFRMTGPISLEVVKADDNSYSFKGDEDYMGGRRGSNNHIEQLRNEYAKEETISWAKYNGRTVMSIKGDAKKGYDIEISE